MDRLASLLLVAACVLCAAPWRPDLELTAFAGDGVQPTALIAALQAFWEACAPAGYRLLLVGVIGLAAWRGLPGNRRRWMVAPARLLLGIALAAAAMWLRYPSIADPVLLAPVVAIAVCGYLLGRALERGLASTIGLTSLSCLALAVVVGLAAARAIDEAPSVPEMPSATAEDRQRWRRMLKGADGQSSDLAVLRLYSNDLNLIAASWLSAQTSRSSMDVEIGRADLRFRLSHPVDAPRLGRRFVNLAVDVEPSLIDGQFAPRLNRIQVGDFALPKPLMPSLSSAFSAALNADEGIRRSLPSIHSLQVEEHALLVVCEPERAAEAVSANLESSPDATEELRNDVRAFMRHSVQTASDLPAGDERFTGLVHTSFAFARERSATRDAISQNRAALIALAIQVGDPSVRRLAGFDPDERMIHFRYPFAREVTLAGRNDLARHFVVSAALRSLSSEEWSFAIGLIKEQLDAAEGGSGFSFADLAADFAGVQFAQHATASEEAARDMQSRLAEPFTTADLMPPIDGLPEGLSHHEFRAQYGSMTDPRFLEMANEFRRRMADCELLGVEVASEPAL